MQAISIWLTDVRSSGTAVLLVDWVTQATVLLLLSSAMTACLRRRSAALRHCVWSLAFAGLLALPGLSYLFPAWRVPVLPVPATEAASEVPLPSEENTGSATRAAQNNTRESSSKATTGLPTVAGARSGRAREKSTFGHKPATGEPASPPSVPPRSNESAETAETAPGQFSSKSGWMHTTLSVWGAGLCLALVPLLVGWARNFRLRADAQPMTDNAWMTLRNELCRRLDVRHPVQLLETGRPVVPMTWGLFRPVVVLPSQAREWSDGLRQSVLLHELVHIKRRDVAFQTLGRVACAVYWFHPLAWYGLRRLRIERELACDDCVLRTGERPSDYAEQLLEIATRFRATGVQAAVMMARTNHLEGRIRALFDRARSRLPLTPRTTRMLLVGACLIVTGLAVIRPGVQPASAVSRQPQERQPQVGQAKGGSATGPAQPEKKPVRPQPARANVPRRSAEGLPHGALMRLGTVRLRHPRRTTAVKFSPDAKLLASAGQWSVRLWDADTARLWREFPAGSHALAFSPNGRKLVTVDAHQPRVRLWDVKTGRDLYSADMAETDRDRTLGAYSVAFHPNGDLFATAGRTGTITLWEMATGRIVERFSQGPTGRRRPNTHAVAFAPDGDLLASGYGENIRIWNLQENDGRLTISPAHDRVVSLAFLSDGETLVSGGFGEIRFWNAASGKKLRELKTGQPKPGGGIAVTPDGRLLASTHRRQITIWDIEPGHVLRRLAEFDRAWNPQSQEIAFSPDGKRLAAARGDSSVQIWDVDTGKERPAFPHSHRAMVRTATYTRDGKIIATGSYDGTVRLWDAETGRARGRLVYAREPMNLMAVECSADGRILAAGGNYRDRDEGQTVGAIKLWRLGAEDLIREIRMSGMVWRLALSPDGTRVAAVSRSGGFAHAGASAGEAGPDFSIRIFDVSTGNRTKTLAGHRSTVQTLAFSTDGQTLFSASRDRSIRTWNVETGEQIAKWESEQPIDAAAFLTNHHLAVTEGGRAETLTVWDLKSPETLRCQFRGLGAGFSSDGLAFSPDGRFVTAATATGDIHVLNASTGDAVARYPAEGSRVSSVAFSPDGKRLLSGLGDGTAIVWDLASADEALDN